MQQVANLETVSRACMQLQAEGQKITGRAVVGITGGSLGTVLSLIKDWRQGPVAVPVSQPDIPSELQAVLIRCLGLAQDKAAEQLESQIDETTLREAEALEGLAEAEKQISILTAQVAEIRQVAADKDQAADKAAAVAAEKIASMIERIAALEAERRQLIEAAEASRTEAAKALMHVERADLATKKAESRLETLEAQIAECSTIKIEAEKTAAVAEQRASNLTEQLTDTRAALAEAKSESKALLSQLSKEIQELRNENKALSEVNKDLEIKNAGLIATVETAKKEKTPVRKTQKPTI